MHSQAQVRCVTTEVEEQRRAMNKSLPSRAQFEDWMAKKLEERRNKLVPFRTSGDGEPDKIAVVVHVIYNEGDAIGEGTNITNEQILSQIEVLNEDYQRKNGDTTRTQEEFLSVASKLNIEFVIARQTITGDPTTGIMRVQGEKSSYNPLSIDDRELLSSYSHWDPNIYLNIWVTSLSNSYIGLAQFPDYDLPGLEDKENRDNEATDGLVIDYRAFGSEEKVPGIDVMPSYNRGRTTTHEIGHFFGLLHVWGDDYVDCSVDDYVADTPSSDNDYSGLCPQSQSTYESCGSNDMYENFLNYTDDECMNIFTMGQVDRMNVILESAPRRASLLNSIGTNYPDDMYFDLAIQSIVSPGIVDCDGRVQTIVEVKNNGTIPVIDFDLIYELEDKRETYSYEGDTIILGETMNLTLPEELLQNGNFFLQVELSNIPDDINTTNNKMDHVFLVDNQTDFIPLREQFEVEDIDQTNWIILNEDEEIGWELTNAPSYSDENMGVFMNLYNYETDRELDWFISPSLDFSIAVEASLEFKTSYAKNGNFDDQLRILASRDCGNDFAEILTVLNSDELSEVNSQDYWEPVDQFEWTERTLDLSDLAGEEEVRIAFVTVNDYGNNLYLDDIEFYTTAEDKLVKTGLNSFAVYPNPSSDGQILLTFNTSERQEITVTIIDAMGRIIMDNIYPNTLNQTYYFDLTGYRSGLYFIHAKGMGFLQTKRLAISR